jgi:engulfment/cell motility protein 1
VRDELNHEALQFVKEQRIRCLLQGAWFPAGISYGTDAGTASSKTLTRSVPSAWRFVRLSHNRRYLHYADFDEKTSVDPRLDALHEKSKCNVRRCPMISVNAAANVHRSRPLYRVVGCEQCLGLGPVHGVV